MSTRDIDFLDLTENHLDHLLVLPGSFSLFQQGMFLVESRGWYVVPQPELSAKAYDVRIVSSTLTFLRHLVLDDISKRGLWHSTTPLLSLDLNLPCVALGMSRSE